MTDFSFNQKNRVNLDAFSKNLANTGSVFGKGFNQLDLLTLESDIGPRRSAITANSYGLNISGYLNPTLKNQDQQGYCFFTRPRMRMSVDNCLAHSTFHGMLNAPNRSVTRLIRAVLDPMGSGSPQRITAQRAYKNEHLYPCDLVDPYMPFIPLLTNNLVTLNGWPDLDIGKYVSREGVQKETFSMVDGVAEIYNNFTLNASFRNLVGDPLGYMFWSWAMYMSLVYQGELTPWVDAIMDNEMDYQLRIYRLTMDVTKTFVQKIAYTGVAMPVVANVGAGFNYSEKPFIEDLDDHQISFDCNGVKYYDGHAFRIFNRHVTDFNVNMLDAQRERTMVKLTKKEQRIFNFSAYPYINEETSELEWWVFREQYNALNRKMYGR